MSLAHKIYGEAFIIFFKTCQLQILTTYNFCTVSCKIFKWFYISVSYKVNPCEHTILFSFKLEKN